MPLHVQKVTHTKAIWEAELLYIDGKCKPTVGSMQQLKSLIYISKTKQIKSYKTNLEN